MDENYREDYNIDYDCIKQPTNCWKDKYTTAVYTRNTNSDIRRYELQPLPDYPLWLKTEELHYLHVELRLNLDAGLWNEIPGLFLPSHVLELCLKVIPEPSQAILKLIALLAWVTEDEVLQYYFTYKKILEETLRSDKVKEQWKNHHLYTGHTRSQLEQQCHTLKIPVNSSLFKHDLVQLKAEKTNEKTPPFPLLYSGDISTIPQNTSSISKLPVTKLRAILSHH